MPRGSPTHSMMAGAEDVTPDVIPIRRHADAAAQSALHQLALSFRASPGHLTFLTSPALMNPQHINRYYTCLSLPAVPPLVQA
jgi:hypothetical protein